MRRSTILFSLVGLFTLVSVAAMVFGIVAVPLGLLSAALVAASITSRMDDLTELAAMAERARQQIAEIDQRARLEQVRLEAVVARRTQQLARRNRELLFVLDNVDQGVFLVDFAGRIGGHQSAAVEGLLGPAPSDGLLTSYVEQFGPEQSAWFGVCWAAVRDGLLPPQLALEQMPREFIVGGKHLELSYQIVNDRRADRVLVVVSDVTARIARERAERDQREFVGMVMRLLSDRTGYLELHAELEHRCAAMERNALTDLVALRRDTHTMKGTAAGAGIASIATACHELEDRLADRDPATIAAAIDGIAARWRELSARIAPFIAMRPQTEVAEEPVRARLERLAGHIRTLSTELGKGPIEVEVDADQTQIARDRWPEVWGALIHVVRNAVDHGLETAEERVAAGKPLEAKIALRAACHDGGLRLEIEDQGRGIDWARVAASARAAGLPAATHDDLVHALFSDGLTTRSEVTATSGRGIGLAAVQQACLEAGGDVRVDSREGVGTRFTFMLPAISQAHPASRRAAGDHR